MANKKLGINVEIKYPDAREIKAQLDEKWATANKGNGYELGVRIKPSNLSEFRKEIQTYLKSEDIEVNVKANKKELIELQNDFKTLKGEMNKELDLKFNYDTRKSITKVFNDLAENAVGVNDSLGGIGNSLNQFNNAQYTSAFGGIVTSLQEMNDGSVQLVETNSKLENSFKRTTEQYVDGELKSITTTEDKLSALRQIVDVQKEINSLNSAKSESNDGREIEAYTSRIKDLTGYMDTLKSDYKEVFGTSPDSEWIVKNAESIGEMNIQLKESAKHQEEVAEGYKRAVEILNEQEATQKRLKTAGDAEKEVIMDKLKYLDEQYQANMRNNDLHEKLTNLQKESLEAVRQEQIFTAESVRAKQEDVESAKAKQAAYRELKSDLNEVFKLEKKISGLKAQEENETISGRDEDKLRALENQLDTRKKIYEQTKENSNLENDLVSSLENQHRAKMEIADSDAKYQATLKESKNLYDDIYDSIKRVDKLNSQMSTAGDNEKRVLQQQIHLEEEKQQEIRDTLKQLDLVNNAREEEVDTLKRAQSEQKELSDTIAQAKNLDGNGSSSNDNNLFRIDPMRVVSELKQGFQMVYDSVSVIDSQMVNIAKVTEAPQAELDAFASSLYEHASDVGLLADVYAQGVERWVTAGFTLQESIANAELSSMGAFVGNINEEAMVDYMSVPLNAFKQVGLVGEDVLNVMNEVANKNAIEMDDLGQAYQRAAGSAVNAGTSFSELTGMISAAQDATRLGGDVIGTAFKAIDINLGKMSAKLTDADERKFDFFKDIGVNLQDANGNLRSTYEIVGDLSNSWSSLNSEQQTTALFYAAGKSHSAVLQGLVGNWDNATKAVGEANAQMELFDKTTGSAFQEFEIQKDSVAFVTAELKNSWAELLNTISGGKDGVNGVLKMLTDVVKTATELAKNDTLMSLAKTALNVTLWLTATTVARSFFKTITSGAFASFKDVKNMFNQFKLFGSTGGMGATKGATNLAKTASVLAETMVPVGKQAVTGGKSLGMFGKAASGASTLFGGFKTVMSTAIPILGAATTALFVIDGALKAFTETGGLIDWGKKIFGNLSDGLNDSTRHIDAFTEANKNYAKELSDNGMFNGSLKQVDGVIEKYNELNKAKKEASEDGVISYSKDEFAQFKTDVAAMSELLGIDIPITFNGQDNIDDVMETLKEAVEGAKERDSTTLAVELNERNSLIESHGDGDVLVADEIDRVNKRYEQAIYEAINNNAEYMVGTLEAQRDRELLALEQDRMAYLEKSEQYQQIIEARREAIATQKDSYDEWVKVAPNLDFDSMGEDEIRATAEMLLATANSTREIDKNYANIIDKIGQGVELTDEEMGIVQNLAGEFTNVDKNTSMWVDELGEEAVNALLETLNGTRETANADEQRTKEAITNALKRTGANDEEIKAMIDGAYGGAQEYIKIMGKLGTTGELAMGVGQVTLDTYGDKWVDVLSNVQSQIEKLDDDVVTKYSLETEDGLVNAQVIETMLTNIPEFVQSQYNLIDEDGTPNIENIIGLIQQVPESKWTEFGIRDETGNFNWENYGKLFEIPEQIIVEYGLKKIDGTLDINEFDRIFKGLDEEYLLEIGADLDESGKVNIIEFIEFLNTIDDEKYMAEIMAESSQADVVLDSAEERLKNYEGEYVANVNIEKKEYDEAMAEIEETANNWLSEKIPIGIGADTGEFDGAAEKVDATTEAIDNYLAKVEIDGDKYQFDKVKEQVDEDTNLIDGYLPEVEIKGDSSDFDLKKSTTIGGAEELDGVESVLFMNGDDSDFNTRYNSVKEKTNSPLSIIVSFVESISSGLSAWWDRLNGGISTSVRINGPTQLQSSMAINPVLNRSFSQSIGDAVSASISQSATSYATSTYSRDYNRDNDREPTKTDTNVWRYWAKELFKGIPLENSMADLERQIKKATDNQEKLIPLYKQQISLIDKQIAYNKEMQKAQQSEMNTTLAALRKEGFKTSGNKITNLDYAKNISGEKADRVNPLLTTYRSLYESINGLNQTIADLNQDKFGLNQSILDSQETIRLEKIAKELEKIQGIITKSEALLTSIENDLGIFTTKLGYISDSDFELMLAISEEGINKSIQSLQTLSKEFNKLSIMNISDSDNAAEVQSHLESLKSSILSNADAILEYREAIKSVEIDRFISDFDKLTSSLETNLDRVSNNIDNIRSGLLSGQSLSDLESSNLIGVDFTRKSGLEKQYEDRLRLEEELNAALEGFADKNVDRTAKVANATLQVEYNKYAELLKMASDYSTGKVSTASVSKPTVGIGNTGKVSTKEDKEYQAWQNQLEKVNAKYEKAYASMVDKYDSAMNSAKTASEKEIINNQMIIDQLRLQEEIYGDLIGVNNSAIGKANEMLKDTSLTTEQRQALLDQIESYKQANIDAQNKIKDSIGSRFELEFELLDKVTDKAKTYSSELEEMLSIAEAVNASGDVIGKIYDAIYEGKINQFAQATNVIEKLAAEQSKLVSGSYEWNLLQTKIDEVREGMSGLTLEILEANNNILSSELDRIQKISERNTLGGKTLEEFNKFHNDWITGISKELEIEKMRARLASIEDKSLQNKIELMDRQEALSKAEVDYLDKQLSVIELQEKLNNLNEQKTVQTLGRDGDGNWQWQYVADQTKYDETKKELDEAKAELEKYEREQRAAYADEMNSIIEKVRGGDYDSENALMKDIENVNNMFDDILGELKGEGLYNAQEIIDAYRKYIENNQDIISGSTGDMAGYDDLVSNIGTQFEKSFLNISADLGKIIGEELRKALNYTPKDRSGGDNFTIQVQSVDFPNVTDATGIEEAFMELPQIAKQMATSK